VDQVDVGNERARHLVLGMEHDLASGVTARVEVYHKRFDDLVVGRLETEGERRERIGRYDFPAELSGEIPRDPLVTSQPSNQARGSAYGFDVYVTRPPRDAHTRLTGWASYTFGKARREAYSRAFPFDYDRRHALSVASVFRVTPRLAVAATARAASGLPWTPFAGVRVSTLDVEEGTRLVPERDAEGRLVYEVAPGGLDVLNRARMPFYARLDLRATFRPRGDKGRWEFYAEAINATRRKNTSSMDATLAYDPDSDRPRLVRTRGSGVPFLPTFGIRFQF
jgi:hypothetical protein